MLEKGKKKVQETGMRKLGLVYFLYVCRNEGHAGVSFDRAWRSSYLEVAWSLPLYSRYSS